MIVSFFALALWIIMVMNASDYFPLVSFVLGAILLHVPLIPNGNRTIDTFSSALIVYSIYIFTIDSIINPMALAKPLW
jgi:hypothetical protein